MAALGKIRSKGVFLIIIIGLGLFGFIAGDMFRSCESTNRAASNRAAVIFGDKIDKPEYAEYVDRYVKVNQMLYQRMGRQANEEELRDEAWALYKQYKLIEHECDELGLTVTNQEFADLMTKGESRLLQPLMALGFVDNENGKFNFQAYKEFMTQKGGKNGETREIYDLLLFYEHEVLKKQLLMQKYTTLAEACILPNPYESQFAFNASNTESDVQLAYIDYSTIKDDAVQCNQSELKAKYDQLKNNFYLPAETRSVEIFYLSKQPTEADRNNLNNNMKKIAEVLRASENTDSVVRKNKGRSYGLYVSNKAFNSYPQMKAKLDSIPVGGVAGPVVDMSMGGKQVYSVVKLLGKTAKPDSIEYRSIVLIDNQNVKPEKRATTTDSIINAIKNGGDFKAIAEKYGQTGESEWKTTVSYDTYENFSSKQIELNNVLDEMNVGEVRTINPQDNAVLIIEVTSKKNTTTMYDVAVIRQELDCSEETINEIDTRFNKFLADNQTEPALKKNAEKFGIQRMDLAELNTDKNGICYDGRNVIPHSDEALRWVFSAEKNDISNIFSCGQDNELLIAVVLMDINEKGFQTLDNPSVKQYVTALVKRDKKAEQIVASLKDVKTIEAAREKKATVMDTEHVTLGSPISSLPGNEPALNGAIAKTQVGQFSAHPIVGNNAVYVFKVNDRRTLNLDEQRKQQISQEVMQRNRSYLSFKDIENNAEIEDNRNLHQN